jgi:hypothetical protein
MATSLSLENDSSLAQGYIKVNGSTAATLTTSGITANLTGNVTGSLTQGGSLTLATAQTASGTAIDFTGIPSWVKRITVMFNGVSLSGSSSALIQIGDSGGIENTGYDSSTTATTGATGSTLNSAIGFVVGFGAEPSDVSGHVNLTNISSNTWIQSHVAKNSTTACAFGGGDKTLSATLDRIRITTVNGTDTFDAGTINISYEG